MLSLRWWMRTRDYTRKYMLLVLVVAVYLAKPVVAAAEPRYTTSGFNNT